MQEVVGRENKADRRWILVGMAVGAACGVIPAVLPDPIGPIFLWLAAGVVGGFTVPSATVFILFLLIENRTRLWWWVSGLGAVIGLVVGVVQSVRGEPPPEFAIAFSGTGGLLLGYAVTEVLLRRSEQAEADMEHLQGGSDGKDVADTSAAPERGGNSAFRDE